MLFVIADTHFFDKNIIKIENRPFKSVDDMNKSIIEKWNSIVSEDDEVLVVGDMFYSGVTDNEVKSIISQLTGKITLIRGNHDTDAIVSVLKSLGVTVSEYPIIVDGFYMISHEPMYTNMASPYANVFGHVHNNPIYKTISPRGYCVSAERIEYTPIWMESVKTSILEASEQGCI